MFTFQLLTGFMMNIWHYLKEKRVKMAKKFHKKGTDLFIPSAQGISFRTRDHAHPCRI
jgi:hypothetical protein